MEQDAESFRKAQDVGAKVIGLAPRDPRKSSEVFDPKALGAWYLHRAA